MIESVDITRPNSNDDLLVKYIRELSNINLIDVKPYTNKFVDLYGNGYRHTYSLIHPVILQIRNSADMDISRFYDNIKAIYNNVLWLKNRDQELRLLVPNETDNKSDSNPYDLTLKGLKKLYDHVSLESSRFDEVSSLHNEIDSMSQELARKSMELENATTKLSNVQTEMIAVLSIFAVVVLAFNGGFTLFGEAFKSVNEAPIQKTLAVLTCSLLLLGDLIFILIYSISRLTGKSLLSLSADKSQGNWFKRVKSELPYIYWYNYVCIFLLILCIIWNIFIYWINR